MIPGRYLRITGRAHTIYETLEPFYADYRKLRYRDLTGKLGVPQLEADGTEMFPDRSSVDS